jgi:SAM-dependent methyltransferase
MVDDQPALVAGLVRRAPGIWLAPRQGEVSYPAHGNTACLAVEETSFWFRHRNKCIVNLVRRFAPDGLFLDIGGGNGYVAKGLMEGGIACALVEPGIDGALAAHARGIDPVICASLDDLHWAPDTIASAGMFDVLEHIEDDAAALRRVHALLPPGGHLFLSVPAYQFLFCGDDTLAGHFRRYTLSSLSRVLDAAGFRVVFASYIFAPLPPLIFLLRTVPSRLGLRRAADPERDAAEHAPEGAAARAMDWLLEHEWRRIAAGRAIPVGASCLCVAISNNA